MNKLLPLAAGMLALLAGTSAQAAPIAAAELKVTGTLDVPACTVVADQDGVYDYGELNPTDIYPGTAVHALAPISQQWKINCEGPTYLTFKAVDNAAASRATVAAENFGLGMVNSTGKLGFFTLTMRNPRVDGVAARVFSTNSTSVAPAATAPVRQDNYQMGWGHPSNASQQIGKDFEVDLDVAATLAGSSTMNGPITDDVSLAGSVTLNFGFGL